MKKKAAIVGCGGIAMVHAQAVDALDGVELCAFADCREKRAEEFADRYGGGRARFYRDFEEMLTVEQPDVVHICTCSHGGESIGKRWRSFYGEAPCNFQTAV